MVGRFIYSKVINRDEILLNNLVAPNNN